VTGTGVDATPTAPAPTGTAGPWFGVFLPQMRMSWPTMVDRVLSAETAGFDSAWLMDHMAPPGAPDQPTFEGWALAAALAARTTRIRLGHLVTCDAFRHPAVLAKMAATTDVISDGRLDLGIGWGSVPEELQTYGIPSGPAAARASRLRESLEVIQLMFSGERFDYAGEHFTLDQAIGLPRPTQAHVPVHIGGAGEKLTMPIVREYADWWNCPTYGVARLAELRELAGDARCSVQHPIALAPDEAGRADVLEKAQRRFGSWGGLIAGTSTEVADALAAEVAAGVDGFVLQFTDFGQPETLAQFMAEVAPVAAATSPAA
jgi:alkanesulfonate monooxygenase SsuD/methylene tetrahydromethanopterin reductase-like flavin-dependent oxidoreductase (luciferase family)